MKTPDEIKKGIECCNSTHYDACPDCPYKGECDAVFSCIRRKSEDTTAYIQQLEAKDAKQRQRIEELEAQFADAKLNHQHTIYIAEKQKEQIGKLKKLVARMSKEIAAISAERDLAAHHAALGQCCETCLYRDIPAMGVPCMDCGDHNLWIYRGICPENTEVSPDA